MAMPRLEELALEELSRIRTRYFSAADEATSSVLVVRYDGTYGHGSAGNDDARYMYAMATAGVAAFEPDAVIHDLSELRYGWGDMLELVFNVRGPHADSPMAIVTRPHCEEAVRSLLSFDSDGKTDPPDVGESVFDDLFAAWDYVVRRLGRPTLMDQ